MRTSSFKFTYGLTPSRFGEVGLPCAVFHHPHESMTAIASELELLSWPGRVLSAGHRLRYRLSLYSNHLQKLEAVFDGARFPIQDVSFHPSKPWVALGTGSYDGGYFFGGELLLWNWQTGESKSLLAESREVVRCRFLDSERLAVLLRPRDEEVYGEERSFDTYEGLILETLQSFQELGLNDRQPDPRLESLQPIEPNALGFEPPLTPEKSAELLLNEVQRLKAVGFQERHCVWDVAWTHDHQIAAVHDNCHLELWSLDGKQTLEIQGEGHGIQLLKARDRLLVHVIVRSNFFTQTPSRSSLFSLEQNHLKLWREFDRAYSFSIDRSDRILARDTGEFWNREMPRKDLVLSSTGEPLFEGDLGSFDCLNHAIRIDGGESLYFLCGSPPSSHERKQLKSFDLQLKTHSILEWDGSLEKHLLQNSACLGFHGSIFQVYEVHNYDPFAPLEGAIDCRSLESSTLQWRFPVQAGVTALLFLPEKNSLFFTLTDGTVGLLNASQGTLLQQEKVQVNGVHTFVTCLAREGNRVVAGTIDGNLILYEV